MQTAYSNEKPADLQPVMQAVARSSLRQLVEKARLLLKLDRFVQAWLPTELKPHCHVMNLNERILVLGLDNAAWVTRMQFISSDLMDALKQEFRTSCELLPVIDASREMNSRLHSRGKIALLPLEKLPSRKESFAKFETHVGKEADFPMILNVRCRVKVI